MSKYEFISLCISGAFAATAIVSYIISAFKAKKANSLIEIASNLPDYIKQAEEIFKGDKLGVAKLQFVLNKVMLDCYSKRVKYDENYYTDEIEKILKTPQSKE